jgi:hypothetical protein
LKIHPPLIGFVGEEYSREAAHIYQRANTKSIKVPIGEGRVLWEKLEKGE